MVPEEDDCSRSLLLTLSDWNLMTEPKATSRQTNRSVQICVVKISVVRVYVLLKTYSWGWSLEVQQATKQREGEGKRTRTEGMGGGQRKPREDMGIGTNRG